MIVSGPIAGLLACTVTYLFTAIGSALVFILPSTWLTDHTHPAHTIVVAIASGMMLAAVMELSGRSIVDSCALTPTRNTPQVSQMTAGTHLAHLVPSALHVPYPTPPSFR